MKPQFGTTASAKILNELEGNGHEAVYVGGAVRDYVLGKPAKDIDIATAAEPHEVKKLFFNTVDIGIEHGTVLVIVDKEPIEVTTFRTDGSYSDHRRPDEVLFVKSLREDLLRRDFTINALAMKANGQLIDLFNGREDLDCRIIRAVGNPIDRFQEDALRMLRAIRFSSVLDFDIETETFAGIQSLSDEISHVSIERLKIEMDKLFLGSNPLKAFRYLEDSKLGQGLPLFPKEVENVSKCLPFYSSIEGWAYLMIAGGFEPTEVTTAYKLSNTEHKFIESVYDAFNSRENGIFMRQDLYKFDLLVLQVTERFYGALRKNVNIETAEDIKYKKAALPIQSIQDIKVDGSDLIKWTGLKGGPWTGKWLKRIEQAVLHEDCENDLIKLRDWFENEFRCEE